MSVLVVGMSHRSAPVALLERLSMDAAVQEDASSRLIARESLSEAMIISTCNRMEIYTVTNSFHAGVRDIVEELTALSGIDSETLRSYLYVRYADAAAEHMMVVASGLDSMVVGEQQIIGQVRAAYQNASERGTVGPGLHAVSQSALRTGKRVHSETGIDDAGASMVTVAFEQALGHLQREDLSGRTALVIGAGAMASLAATHMGRLGVEKIIVANRTVERAHRLAAHSREAGIPAEGIPLSEAVGHLGDVDIAVSATGAEDFTITVADIPEKLREKLMLVDLSLPRDIEDAAGEIDGVHLVNIESLHKSVTSRDSSSTAHLQAQDIVSEELGAYSSEQRVRDVAPAVTALRKGAARIADSELDRLRGRLPEVDDTEFTEITRTVKRVVDKLLHEPTVQAKRLAAESGSLSYETALQQLFGLDAAPARAVAVDATELPESDLAAQCPAIATPEDGKDTESQ
ncbi:glutamyl-tRNA reductase [Corynebacterium yudongzhengii]|uniref:Glutamyl-tRNA reductase n=1 Tax=Corynebacterium yudongzhengii TaxID=2080740 RepID=A0A2U1T9M8_9CORY|nr:glutamyl-tRNA reductase [Corynebacterium yudongzhengii]AWB81160.1 glutamyl-tRNA reductase [Corynebacterium yudongzhengii]PWC02699.1 glutamyl-tRNA reductase [Corynebacterium yudongzhengii]